MFSGFAPQGDGAGAQQGAGGGLAGMMGRLGGGGAGAQEPLLPGAGAPGGVVKLTPEQRMGRYIEAAAKLSESKSPQFAAALRALKPIFSVLLEGLVLLVMGYAKLYSHIYEVYRALPMNQIEMVIGLLLCFFGGTYVTLIAAIEAFRTMGGQGLWGHLTFVWDQVKVVAAADARDSLLDENRDGIADVDQISVDQLTQRKVKVCMTAVTDPARLQSAVGSLWSACLAVLATLKLQFAQTAAYAMAIAELVKFPVLRLTAPYLTWGLGPELTQWVDPLIDSTLRIVCILLVWYMEKVRAAFYSGIRGGRMFAEALISFLEDRGLMDSVPDFIAKKPFKADESYLDEAIAYSLAALGFWWQISNLFWLPFPLDWILWPVSMLEYFLEVQVSWAK